MANSKSSQCENSSTLSEADEQAIEMIATFIAQAAVRELQKRQIGENAEQPAEAEAA